MGAGVGPISERALACEHDAIADIDALRARAIHDFGDPDVVVLLGESLGGLVATMTRFTPSLSMAVVGLFALFHGYAHGHEMPAAASALPFSVGFVLATALLHGMGLAAGLGFQEKPLVLRWAGAAIASSSVCFFVS